MRKRAKGRPTDLELEILKVLWERGPSTVREVREVIAQRRPIAYTTVLRMFQVMTEKKLVVRDDSQRAHIYQPRHSQRTTLRKLTDDLLTRAFDGSVSQLVVHALDDRDPVPEELAEIRRMLDEIDGKQR